MHATTTRHLVDPRSGAAAAVVAAIFAAGIALGTLIASGAPAVGSTVYVPLGDRRYDAVEETRADRGLD
jgi:heme/copper-type cytochrome/quinol oxidase subunit 1